MFSIKPGKLKQFILVAGILFVDSLAYSQTTYPTPTLNTSLIPPSPNAATFAKVGNIPVTLYNGLPNVSVPVFNVSVGSLSMPVSLDYNYSGFKPKEDASWVGLGWNLNAGGVITRIVRGDLDGSQTSGHNYEEINALDSSLMEPQNQLFLNNLQQHNYDGEPDIFSFNFPGHSGKFIYYHGKGYVMPYAKLKVFISTDQSFIRITDEQGTVYLFQDFETSTPHAQPDYSMPAYKSSWFLSKIISADLNDTIRLQYTSMQMLESGSPYSESYQKWNPESCPGDPENGADYGKDHYSSYPYAGTQMQGLLLTNIFSRNFNVDFVATTYSRKDVSNNNPALSYIRVTNNFGYLLKTINFKYTYFGDSAYGTCKLRLDKVTDAAYSPNPENHEYAFVYDDAHHYSLPEKITLGIDYWGYYNGQINNLSLFPATLFTGTAQPNGVRTPDFSSAKLCALTSVYFPEGGVTDFTYELNDYKDETTGANMDGPGIRINKMTSYDPTNVSNKFIKNFYYQDAANKSSGILVATPDFTPHLYTNQSSYQVDNGHDGLLNKECDKQFYNYTADFVSVNNTITNQTLYYSYVTEITGTNDTTARSDYYYNCNCGHQYDYFTGVQLTEQIDFKNIGNATYVKAKETDYLYSVQVDTMFSGVKSYVSTHADYGQMPPSGLNDIFKYDSYTVPVAWSYLSSQTDKLFDDQGNTFTTSKTFSYDPTTRNLASTLSKLSDGRTMLQELKYPEDYTSSVTGALVTAHVLSPVIEEQVWLKNSSTDSSLVAGKITAYDATLFKPLSEYYFENNSPPVHSLNNETKTGSLYNTLVSDTRYAQRVFCQYGSYGLLTQQNLSNDVINSFIWGYNSTLPLAAVKNAPVNKIAYTGFEDDGTGGWAFTGTNLNTGGASGTRAFNGQVQKTVSSGNYTVTAWAYTGTNVTVNSGTGTLLVTKNNWNLYQWKLTNVSSVTVSGTRMDDVRLFPTGAQMTTFTYTPGIGITTQSDLNNRISFYEYDGFGRLRLIRDADKNILKLFQYHYRIDHVEGGGLE